MTDLKKREEQLRTRLGELDSRLHRIDDHLKKPADPDWEEEAQEAEMDEVLVQYVARLSNEISLDKVYFLNVTKNLELPEEIIKKYPDMRSA